MRPITPNQIWDDLRPRIVALIEERAGVRIVGGGSSGGSSITPHDLGGALHLGSLRNDQATQFLLTDGTRELAGNLAVSSGVTVDGVDISAHAANPDAHHAQTHSLISTSDHTISGAAVGNVLQATGATTFTMAALDHQYVINPLPDQHHARDHLLVGSTHTASGLTTGQVVRASGATTFAWAQLQHSDLGGVTSDQHHAKLHAMLDTAHHSYSGGAALDVFGLSAPSTLAKLTPSASPGAASAILRSDSSGYLTLVRLTTTDRVRTPLIDTGSGDLTITPASSLVLNPASNLVKLSSSKSLQSDNYASQTTGMRVTHAGEGDFRYLFTDELHAKAFIADLEQALAGGQIISKSVTMLSRDFTAPAAGGTATLYVRDLPSAEDMAVFESGDIIRLRKFSRSGGALSVSDCWGSVSSYTDLADKEQSWTFTRSSAPNAGAMSAGTVVATDSIVLDYGVSGNGFHEVNAIDGAYALNSPYSQIVTWATHPATGQTVRVRTGNLRGLFSVANEYGFYAGSGVTDADAYLRLSSYTTRFNNLDTRWYSGGVPIVRVNSSDGISVKANSSMAYDDILAYTLVDASEATLGGLYGYDASNVGNIALRSETGSASRTASINVVAYNSSAGVAQAQISAQASTAGGTITVGNQSNSALTLQSYSGAASKQLVLDTSGLSLPSPTTIGGNTAWHAGNDGAWSGLDADFVDGRHAAENGSNVVLYTQSNGYLHLDNWIRQDVGQGLFGNSSPYAPHWFSHLDGWIGQSGNSSKSFVKLQTAGGVDRGFLYADSSNYVGLLDYSGAWRVKVSATTTDIFGTLTVDGSGEHKLAKATNTYLYAQAVSGDRVKLGVWDSGGAVARKLCLNEAGGFVGVGCSDPAVELDVNGYSVRVRSSYTPASAGATGLKGQICYDGSYVYVCTATNTWKRAALSSW